MTSPLSSSDLAAIEARAEAATPGPWEWWTSCSYRRLRGGKRAETHVAEPTVQHRSDNQPDIQINLQDQDFIAAARTDIPLLIAEIKRLKGEANG